MKIKAILLVILVSLFTLKSGFLMSYYLAFTNNFIENFCVNKDQPELECDGKCFLSKMLDKSPTDDHTSSFKLFVENELIYVLSLNSLFGFAPVEPNSSKFAYINFYNGRSLDSLIKPPELL